MLFMVNLGALRAFVYCRSDFHSLVRSALSPQDSGLLLVILMFCRKDVDDCVADFEVVYSQIRRECPSRDVEGAVT